jgi:hypothetical protein
MTPLLRVTICRAAQRANQTYLWNLFCDASHMAAICDASHMAANGDDLWMRWAFMDLWDYFEAGGDL